MAEDSKTYEVDDFPEGMSLDDLLSGNKDLDVDVKSLETDLEEIEPVDYPHIRVSTKRFIEVLKLSNIVSQGAGRDLVSKAIGLEVKGGELQFYLSDSDVFIERSIDLINEENVLEDFIPVNFAIISKMVKACSASTVIYKKDNKYYIKLIGGDMELDTIAVSKSQLVLTKAGSFAKVGEIVTNDFYKVIRNLFTLASASVTPSQRRVFFRGDKVYAIFLYCLAEYTGSKAFPDMDLNLKSMKMLYSLANTCEDVELVVSKNNNRVMIGGSNFSYSFLTSEFVPTDKMIDGMGNILSNAPVYVNYDQLVKITDVSSDLMYSTSRLDFNYTDDGTVECILRTKKSDSKFVLKGVGNKDLVPMNKHISIQSSLLKVMLKVFAGESTVGIVLSDDGIGVVSGDYRAVLYTEG